MAFMLTDLWFLIWRYILMFGQNHFRLGVMSQPERGRKINDSLYLLYSPPEGRPVNLDVIFFHGLQPVRDAYANAFWNTWSSDGGATAWPQTLLVSEKAFPRARIFSISYDSAVVKSVQRGAGDIFTIAENLVADIIVSDNVAERGQLPVGQLPIVLVGHSLGGLVIKKFLLMTCEMKCDLDPKDPLEKVRIEKLDTFVKNVRGVFSYSTPHHGTTLADVARQIPNGREGVPVLTFLKTLSNETERLNERFRKWRKKNDIKAFTICESLSTRFDIFGVKTRDCEVIVTEASARHDSEDHYTVSQNHVNVCKPEDMFDSRFLKLQQFITTSVQEITSGNEEENLLR